MTSVVGGVPVMDVDCHNKVLVVKVMGGDTKTSSTSQEAMMAVIKIHLNMNPIRMFRVVT